MDYANSKTINPKIAVEVLAGHGKVAIIAETSVSIPKDIIDSICNRILRPESPLAIDYTEVPQDEHLAANQNGPMRCGDNGIFKGMPVTETQSLLAIISKKFANRFDGHDGKYVIKLTDKEKCEYDLTVCQSHATKEEIEKLLYEIEHESSVAFNATVNPLGEWTGGIETDSGATNRKLGSDMGDGATGGGLHGKDLTKADVSVNIMCHIIAQQTGKPVYANCSIGDENVTFVIEGGENLRYTYQDIWFAANEYIENLGGFEKLAEEGLIAYL